MLIFLTNNKRIWTFRAGYINILAFGWIICLLILVYLDSFTPDFLKKNIRKVQILG